MSGRRATALGPTETYLLRQWGRQLREAFGEMPYLVGSVVRDEAWRDVDVRLMLPDGDPLLAHPLRLAAMNVAITVWGQRVTGLPIDFQFQAITAANAEFDGVRHPIGIGSIWRAAAVQGEDQP